MDYGHGGDIYGNDRILLDFSVNTNPLGLPERVRQAVISQSECWEHYPDFSMRRLRTALADYYRQEGISLEREDFICGNGAADLLYSLVFAVRPGRALLFSPCFTEYESALHASGCEVKKILLDEENDFNMDFSEKKVREYLSCNPDICILGNPNNPTGQAIPVNILEQWASVCREKNVLLVVDECFNGFLENPVEYTLAGCLKKYPNVFLLNAWTKIYAMAGLRLGYGICKNQDLLKKIEAVRQPWSVSAPAEAAGIQALKERDFVIKSRAYIGEERAAFLEKLTGLGFRVYPSKVNYLLFRSPDQIDYKTFLRAQGILIRSCKNFDGLGPSYYRTAVRMKEENDILLSYLAKGRAQSWQK